MTIKEVQQQRALETGFSVRYRVRVSVELMRSTGGWMKDSVELLTLTGDCVLLFGTEGCWGLMTGFEFDFLQRH